MLGLRWPTRKVRRDCHFCGHSALVERALISDWNCVNPLCGQRNLSHGNEVVAATATDRRDGQTDVYSERIPAIPVDSPFCPRCEESLQASLHFRANYQLGESDEAIRMYEWERQAFERTNPLACPACEPNIRQIIDERDSPLKAKVWAAELASRSKQLEEIENNRPKLGWRGWILRRWGMDAELWVWRTDGLGWALSIVLYALWGITDDWGYALWSTVGQWRASSWIPWWKMLRFRMERVEGEQTWKACEKLICVVRLVTIVLVNLALPRALRIGIGTEFIVRLYAISCLKWIRPGLVLGPGLQRSERKELSARSLITSCMTSAIDIFRSAPNPISRITPVYETNAVEDMDWEPEQPPAVPILRNVFETPQKERFPTLRSSKRLEFTAPTPPSPLDDWTRFKNDIMTEMRPVTNASPAEQQLGAGDTTLTRPFGFLPAMTSETFRIGYAFSALVRILAIVSTVTSGSTTISTGFLAEAPSIVDMISSAGSGLAGRQTKQAMTTRRTMVTLIQALHCIHMIFRWISAHAKPLQIIAQAANKHGSLIYWRILVEMFWIVGDVLVWLAL